MLVYPLTVYEVGILEDIEEIGFGEIYDLKHEKNADIRKLPVSEKQKSCIEALRHEGFFSKLVIHEGDPVSAEYPKVTENGRKALQKIRF